MYIGKISHHTCSFWLPDLFYLITRDYCASVEESCVFRIYIKKNHRCSVPLMCSCSFYHFKQNTVMQGEDRSQMAMFMDYLPKVVVNYKEVNLLAALCHNQSCYGHGDRYWLWGCQLVYIHSKRGICTVRYQWRNIKYVNIIIKYK